MRSISTDYIDLPSNVMADEPTRAGEARNGYRPRASTVERSREIREIAARYIARHGLWKFSMLALARHLKCLLPTLCYYYKKREELIADIVLRHVETLRVRTGLAMDEVEDGSPANELRAFAREYLLVALAEQDFHRLMVGYADLAGPDGGKPFITRRESLREMVEGRLTAHAPSLAGKPEPARALSRAMLDTLSGAATWLEPYGVVKPVAYAAMVSDWLLDQATRC
jgi:AcrR family transcriptional regulator